MVFNRKDLLDRMMRDYELARMIAGVFLETLPRYVDTLSDALAGSDLKAARLAAHSIKGAAANMGAEELSRTAAEAERLCIAGDVQRATGLIAQIEDDSARLRPLLECFSKGTA